MTVSPSTLNYFIGKGIAYFTPTGGSERDLGNCPEIEFTPTLEELAHYSSREGVRTKDREIVLEKSASLRFVLDEITPENLALALLGTESTNTAGEATVDIFSVSEITGQFRLAGTNDVGSKYEVVFPSISISPSGSVPFISDEWMQLEITAEVLVSGGVFGTIRQTDEVTA